jgi:hypothetical protein
MVREIAVEPGAGRLSPATRGKPRTPLGRARSLINSGGRLSLPWRKRPISWRRKNRHGGQAFGLVRLAVAEGFEPSEAFTSHAFEFCGGRSRPIRLRLVAPEPSLDSPLRTPPNLRE